MGDHSYEYSNKPVCKCYEILLRILAAVLSLAALVVMSTNKQVVEMLGVTFVAKPIYVKTLMYVIYANGIVAVYSVVVVVALLICFFGRARCGKFFAGIVFLLDQVITYVLLGAAAAAADAAYIAKRGNDKVYWGEVCSYVYHYCIIAGVSLLLTYLSVLVMALLSILSARRLFHIPVPLADKTTPNHV